MTPQRVEGVCAFIPHPVLPAEKFLTLYETEFKRKTNKLPGMRAPIIETVEEGETHSEALMRAIYEELTHARYPNLLPGNQEELDRYKLCEVQLSPNAWLVAYLVDFDNRAFLKDVYVRTLSQLPGSIPSARVAYYDPRDSYSLRMKRFEVCEPRWTSSEDVLASKRNPEAWLFAFRPSVVEIVESYLQRLRDPKNFKPGIYPDPINQVPQEIFDILEQNGPSKQGGWIRVHERRDPTLIFPEVRVAEIIQQIGINPSSYLERFRQYHQQLLGFDPI